MEKKFTNYYFVFHLHYIIQLFYKNVTKNQEKICII